MPLSPGTRLGAYEIVSLLGSGGMGEVYRAKDTRLDRTVAIKVVLSTMATDPHWRERFDREARAIAVLNHPHICTLHDVAHQDGIDFLVMEYLEGETLVDRLRRGHFSFQKAAGIAAQIADALAAAHARGLIHRDIKPANVFLTARDNAKVLDFGLAKLATPSTASAASTITRLGTISDAGAAIGTIAYMSPEQMRGLPIDYRSDLFSLGIVLYEMLTGERPFGGDSAITIADAIMHDAPRPLRSKTIPHTLKSLVRRLLEKDPGRRFGTAEEVRRALTASTSSTVSQPPSNALRAVAATLVLAVAAGGWFWYRSRQERTVLATTIPEIARLVEAEQYGNAVALIRQARAVLPDDATLVHLWTRATGEVSITTVPSDAEVSIRPFRGNPDAWTSVGHTPLRAVRVPKTDSVWRINKPGFAPLMFIQRPPLTLTFKLWTDAAVPPEMVVVRGSAIASQAAPRWPFADDPTVQIDDFLIDRQEVTNVEYKRFVEAGGYQRRDLWDPFVRDGLVIPWEQGIASFRDTTNRPAPATWEAGTFPNGMERFPVAGVSWYEAAAYERFVGNSLPTTFHWTRAGQTTFARLIVPTSNFSKPSAQPVGLPGTLSGFGTTDMAGNLKEWCLNESSGGTRFILGGGFGEPNYMFNFTDARSPWERRPNYGFRGVKLPNAPAPAVLAKLELPVRDVWKDVIASDEVVAAYKGLYAYDHSELKARVENQTITPDWTHEKVSFNAAYGNERVLAHLFLPRHASPPYQSVVYFPGASAVLLDHFDESTIDGTQTVILSPGGSEDSVVARQTNLDFLLKNGRAVLFPVYKSTFERQDNIQPGGPITNAPVLWRDHMVAWSKDLGRSLDYLETRSDIDSARLAYFGFSWGGAVAPVLLAVESRFKAAVLSSGGTWFQRALPEADAVNFARHVTLPVLMLSGRYDDLYPVETGQLPIFRRLGTADKDKKHVIYEAGHGGVPHTEEVRETLDWLDKYLGPVKK